jgi:hypothetical protein
MGLRRDKVQSISTGFYILPRADDKEASTYQEKRYVPKKRKVSIKMHNVPRLGLGGLHRKKGREESLSANHIKKYRKETVYGTDMSIFLSLYPKKFGYSLGGYFHRERCRAPDRKKSTGERREIEANGKKPTGRQVV